MTSPSTLAAIRRRFNEVESAGPELFRAEMRTSDRPLGIFYFDFGSRILSSDFSLNDYLQERIASDFYRHEGSIQWNFYLYFVLNKEEFERIRSGRRLNEIESDRTYARKFVREEASLRAELSEPLAGILRGGKPNQDLASIWTGRLVDAGLGQIADPEAEYSATVRDIISGKHASEAPTQGSKLQPEPGKSIQSLRLEAFRDHPTQKEFSFESVNLVRGANGSGKTSLLEAIELSICGGMRRHAPTANRGAKIAVRYENSSKFETCPSPNLATYRARDLHWYGGYYRQGNQLCHNFARFNFFDSDAAFRLSSATSSEEIVEAIDSLLLGEFATTIEERMKQFCDRFVQQERELRKSREKLHQEVDKATLQLTQLTEIKDTREALALELQGRAADSRWMETPSELSIGAIASLRESVQAIAEQFSQVPSRIPWLGRLTIHSLTRKVSQLEGAVVVLAQCRKQARAAASDLKSTDERIADAEAKLAILRRIGDYHSQIDGMNLIGSSEKTAGIEAKLGIYREIGNLLREVDLSKYSKITSTMEELMRSAAEESANCRRSLTRLTNQAAEIQNQLGELRAVTQEIRGLGLRFCQINPRASDCPLCGERHSSLSDRIRAVEFGSPFDEIASDLKLRISRKQSELKALVAKESEVQRLNAAVKVALNAGQVSTRTVKSLVSALMKMPENEAEERARLSQAIATRKRLERQGFSEDELSELFQVAQYEYSITKGKLVKKELLNEFVEELIDNVKAQRDSRRGIQKLQRDIEQKIHRTFSRVADDLASDQNDVDLKRRLSAAEDVLERLRVARGSVAFWDSEEVSNVEARLVSFANALDRLQGGLERLEQKDQLQEVTSLTLMQAKKELESIVPKHERSKSALAILTELLQSRYKRSFTEQVVNDHCEKLSVIFSRIHSPNEFKGVILSPELLLERRNGKASKISEISTGQRAALALSIFLSLNSSVSSNAPWLLFDDPVVHVDDLNVLSFLDVLRDLVLLGGRQVFFATASMRIADLFARKFDCLGDEFTQTKLTR